MGADGSMAEEDRDAAVDDPAPGDGATYPRMGSVRLPYIGLPRDAWRDGYHFLLTMPTPAFVGMMSLAFLSLNTLFATLYVLDPGGLTGARPGSFEDAFFFSVETFGTIGYGVMAPKSLYCNLVMTVETFFGLFNLAIATGCCLPASRGRPRGSCSPESRSSAVSTVCRRSSFARPIDGETWWWRRRSASP